MLLADNKRQHRDLPLVTYVLLSYNQRRYILDALDSMLRQDYPCVQWLIADDASSDGSVEVIRSWLRDHAVDACLIAHEQNRGICATLNEVLTLAKGKYISVCAADDVWLPDRTSFLVSQMERLGERVAVIYGDVEQMDELGRALPKTFMQAHLYADDPPTGDVEANLLEGNFIPHASTFIRRACYDAVGLYDERLCYEDWDMWLRLAQSYQFAFVSKKTAKYRVVADSMTRRVLWTESPVRYDSEFIICKKRLTDHRLTADQRCRFRRQLADRAFSLFALGAPQTRARLVETPRYHASWRVLLRLLLCILPLSWRVRNALLARVDWRLASREWSARDMPGAAADAS